MTVFNTNITLDGSTSFSIADLGTFSWNNNFLYGIDLFDPDAGDTHEITMNLTGSNWAVRNFSISGNADYDVSIVDTDAGPGRTLEHINMFVGGTMTMDLQTTSARSIFLTDGQFDLSLGSGFFSSIQLNQGSDNTVRNDASGFIQWLSIGALASGTADNHLDIEGRLNAARIFQGVNTIDVAGRIDSLVINEADSTTITGTTGSRIEAMTINGFYDSSGDLLDLSSNTIDAARIDSARINGGDNDITIRDRADAMTIYDSVSDITVTDGARIAALTGTGTNTIDLLGSARIFQARLDDGIHSLTSQSGIVDSYISYNSTNTLNIGSGGLQQLRLGSTVGTQTIDASGFVGSAFINGPGNVDMALLGGMGSILAFGAAEYTLTLGSGFNGTAQLYASSRSTVTTGTGEVVAIFTGDGDDLITALLHKWREGFPV